jgi:predicted metal-dependent hydrolase
VVTYTVKRSYRARQVRLEVRPATGLTVIIPRRYPVAGIPEILLRKSKWLLRMLEKYPPVPGERSPAVLKTGDTVHYLGKKLVLELRPSFPESPGVRMDGDRLIVDTDTGQDGHHLKLEAWYRRQASGLFREKLDRWCPVIGVTYGRLSIRGQRTRWGSCSPQGNISLNWKLMLVPEPVIDYVIVHELAHRREMNHSPRFWKLVAAYCPGWREYRQWLHDCTLLETGFKA